jgi:hypothetical protein
VADENTALGAAAVSASGRWWRWRTAVMVRAMGLLSFRCGGCGRWVGLMFFMSIGCRKEAKRQTLKNGNSKTRIKIEKAHEISSSGQWWGLCLRYAT